MRPLTLLTDRCQAEVAAGLTTSVNRRLLLWLFNLLHSATATDQIITAHLAVLAQGNRSVGLVDCFFQGQPSIDLINGSLVCSVFIEEVFEGNLSIALSLQLIRSILVEDRFLVDAARSPSGHLLQALACAKL